MEDVHNANLYAPYNAAGEFAEDTTPYDPILAKSKREGLDYPELFKRASGVDYIFDPDRVKRLGHISELVAWEMTKYGIAYRPLSPYRIVAMASDSVSEEGSLGQTVHPARGKTYMKLWIDRLKERAVGGAGYKINTPLLEKAFIHEDIHIKSANTWQVGRDGVDRLIRFGLCLVPGKHYIWHWLTEAVTDEYTDELYERFLNKETPLRAYGFYRMQKERLLAYLEYKSNVPQYTIGKRLQTACFGNGDVSSLYMLFPDELREPEMFMSLTNAPMIAGFGDGPRRLLCQKLWDELMSNKLYTPFQQRILQEQEVVGAGMTQVTEFYKMFPDDRRYSSHLIKAICVKAKEIFDSWDLMKAIVPADVKAGIESLSSQNKVVLTRESLYVLEEMKRNILITLGMALYVQRHPDLLEMFLENYGEDGLYDPYELVAIHHTERMLGYSLHREPRLKNA